MKQRQNSTRMQRDQKSTLGEKNMIEDTKNIDRRARR
jgi:hypothetical protein